MGNILFFGYGANKSRSKIQQIIKRDPGTGIGAVLEGYTLNTQSLNNIPENPRKIIFQLYGSEFKSYSIKKGDGIVLGVIWETTPEELELIKDWESVGTWRELIEVDVKSSANQIIKVVTEKSHDTYPTDFIVDGLLYDVFAFTQKAASTEKRDTYYTQKQISQIRSWLKKQS